MAFELIDRQPTGRPRDVMNVKWTGHHFVLSLEAMEHFAVGDYLCFYGDKATGEIAIKARANEPLILCRKLAASYDYGGKSVGPYTVAAKHAAVAFGIPVGKWAADWRDGMLVFKPEQVAE